MPDSSLIDVAANYGLIGLTLLLVLFFGAYGARVIYIRLFDSTTGLVTIATNRHIAFVDAVRETLVQTLKLLESQEGHMAELVNRHTDPNSTFSTIKTNRAIWHLAEAVAEEDPEVRQRYVEDVKRALALSE